MFKRIIKIKRLLNEFAKIFYFLHIIISPMEDFNFKLSVLIQLQFSIDKPPL
jgi:hypothetical protein